MADEERVVHRRSELCAGDEPLLAQTSGWFADAMMPGAMRDPVIREFLLAFWKIHILHHADEDGVYGQWMLEELQHHGYRLSPGTLYPILARMARRGWLRASEPKRSTGPRLYRLTPRGREVLAQVRHSLDELYREVGGSHTGKRSR